MAYTAYNLGLAQAGHCLVEVPTKQQIIWLVANVFKPRLRQALARYVPYVRISS